MLTSAEIDRRYRHILESCRQVFCTKGNAYGPTWAAFRWVSLTDQLWIKIKRIRQLESHESRVPEGVEGEYMALINYALIFLMRLQNPALSAGEETILEDIERIEGLGSGYLAEAYDAAAAAAFELYGRKNHDYGNAWQEMDPRAITDMVLIKVLRIKHILAQSPGPGPEALAEQLHDIINYSVFALILRQENKVEG